MSDVTNCNQCRNACKLDEVKCGRGEKYREYILGGGKPEEYEPPKGEAHGGGERDGKHGEHERHGGHEHHGEHVSHSERGHHGEHDRHGEHGYHGGQSGHEHRREDRI